MPHRQDLHATLAKARQELQQAQSRVVELEAKLFERQPNHLDLPISEQTDYHSLDTLVAGCEIIGFDWRYLYINDAAAHYERRAKGELLGCTLMERHPAIEKTFLFTLLQRCMRERSVERTENEVIYPDGSSAWLELLVQPVPEGIFVLAQEITARKQTEQALLEREQQFRRFVEHTPEAFAMLDNNMRYLLVSRRWLTDYRLSESDVIGCSHYALFPDLPERRKEIHQRCLAGAVESSEADPFFRADGSLDWVRWKIQPWRKLDGTIGGLLILSEVVTERKRAEDRIRQLHRTLGVLSDINQAIVRIRHMPSLFEKACAIAVEKGAFRMAWLGLFDPKTGQIASIAHAGSSASDLEKLIRALNTHPLSGELRVGEHLICNDIQNDPIGLAWREEASRLGYRATVVLPLIVAGEIRGIFNLYASETAFFDEQEMRLMDEMAADISFAIEVAEKDEQRQQAEATIKRYAMRMEILHQIDSGIINASSIEAVVETALKHIRAFFACEQALVGLFDHATNESVIFACDLNTPFEISKGTRIPTRRGVFDEFGTGKVVVIDDLQLLPESQPAYASVKKAGLRSALRVSLTFQGHSIGLLALNAAPPKFFTAEHQAIAAEIADQIAIAIHQLQLSEQLARHTAELEEKVAERTVALTDAKQRVEAILNNSLDCILLIHADLTIQQVNSAFNRLFAAPPDNYLGQSLLTLFHTADVDRVAKLIEAVVTEQHGKRIEIRALYKNGKFFDAELTIGLIKGDGMVCTLSDITERKAQERQLRYHAALQENLSDAVIATDMELRIQSWNQAAVRTYGWTAEEAIGKVAPAFLQIRFLLTAQRETEVKQLNEQGFLQQETIQRRKDGADIFILGSATQLYDESGMPIGVIAINRDITERRRSEEALRMSEGRYRLLAENIADIIMTFSLDRLITYMSPSCEKLLGYLPEEVEGKVHSEFIHPEDYPQVVARTRRAVVAKEDFYTNQFRLRHKTGHYIWYEVRTRLVFDANTGNVVQFISILRDITERKRANDALREGEERFRRAIIDAPFPIMIHADNGEVLHISNVWAEISGYTHAEIPTMRDWIAKAYRENGETIRPLIEKVYTLTKPRRGGEFRIHTKAGEERIWDFISAPLAVMPDGRRMVSSMAMDITERKQAEAALQKKIAEEHQFQVYLKALHEVIIELTGIDQLDTFYKRAVELGRERLGFERLAMFLYDARDDTAIGTYGTNSQGQLVDERGVRFTPDPNGVMQRSFERVERFFLKEETPLYNDEVPVGYGWNAAALLWNGTQSLGWFVADNLLSREPASKPLLDILGLYALSVGPLLAQKQTQLALKESETLYRLLAENISDLILRATVTSECLYASPSVETLLGYTPEELIGQQTFSLIHPDDQVIIGEAYAAALERHEPILPHQYRARHKAGHYIWLETVGKPIFNETSTAIEEVITSSRDVTIRKLSEEALRESEEKFRLLLDAAPVATVISDQTGRISLVNGQAEHLFGYGREELTGRMVELLVPDYARSGHVNNRITYVAAPRVRPMGLGMALYARHKDGSEIPVEIELSYIETRQGMMVMSFIMDITERKRVAAELEQQRSFLRNVIDVSPSIIFVKDYNGRFVLVNPSAAKLYNTTIEALIGKTDADFNPIRKEVNDFLAADRQVITSGEMLFVEEPVTNPTGEVHWLQTTKVPIISADGKAKYVLGVAADITERKEAEAALRASEEKYRSLVETMQGGLAVFDPEMRVTFVNDRFCELLGYSREEAIGKQPANIVDAADMPLVQAHLERRYNAERTSYEIPLRHKDGHQIQMLLSGSPLLDKQGQYTGSIVVATDISLQKQAEETLRQALAKEKELGDLKTRFVSMASHEFRTPLATILALVETLSVYRKKLSEEQVEQRFAKIKVQIGHLRDIMEDVLMLARLQARRVEFNPIELDLDALCRSVLDEFQSQAQLKHRLEYSVSEGLHEVLLDQKLIRQIISNLIANAIKYSPEDKVVRIHLVYTAAAVILKVSDEGIGIPEADLSHLFEPFHRAANVGTISGTGLGLVITREAVELHGGTITVESQQDVGTTFLVRIPIYAGGD